MNYTNEFEKYNLIERECSYCYNSMYDVIPKDKQYIHNRVASIEAQTAEIVFHNPNCDRYKPEFLIEIQQIAEFLYKEYNNKNYCPVS